ncbi:MAG: serine protease Do [Alphaproteobacteria bacterium]|jgi:serine protease Do
MQKSRFLVLFFVLFSSVVGSATAQTAKNTPDVASILAAVVKITASVPAGARTAKRLGTKREGSGVVIDSSGLVLTIGYLMLEADRVDIGLADGRTVAAKPVAYDHDTGLGLVRATEPLGIKPAELGDSGKIDVRDQVLAVAHGGQEMTMPAMVVSRRPFAGSWEYLLERAIYTVPAHPVFGGAALFSSDGKLVGIGSLIIADAAAPSMQLPGNMFVPIDMLKPIFADLLDKGRVQGPLRPWLGVYADELRGRLFVSRLAQGGPASEAGIEPGDMLVGVNGAPVTGLADFYRKIWTSGSAGTTIKLDVLRGISVKPVAIKSTSRYQWLKMERSY